MKSLFVVGVMMAAGQCFMPAQQIPLGELVDAGSFDAGTGGGGFAGGGGFGGGGGGPAGGIQGGSCTDCPSGSCTILASGRSGPHALASDSTHLYWLEVADGGTVSLLKMPIGGGPVATLATGVTSSWNTPEIAVDSTGVYGTDFVSRRVWKVPLTGGPAAPFAFTLSAPHHVTASSPYVYVSTETELIRLDNDSNGRTTLISPGTFRRTLADPPNLFIATTNGVSMGQLLVMNDAGVVTPLASSESIGHLAVNDTEIFYTSGYVGKPLMRLSKSGGTPSVLVPNLPNQPNGLAADSTHAYAIVGQIIVKVNLSDGGMSPFVDGGGADLHVSMATDDTSVYWSSAGCGVIARKTK